MSRIWNTYQIPDDFEIPKKMLALLSADDVFFLDSANHADPDLLLHENVFLKSKSRYSYLGLNPLEEFESLDRNILIASKLDHERNKEIRVESISEVLLELDKFLKANADSDVSCPDFFAPQFLIVLSYDFGEKIRQVNNPLTNKSRLPDIYCSLCRDQIVIDHTENRYYYNTLSDEYLSISQMRWRLESIIEACATKQIEDSRYRIDHHPPLELSSNFTENEYHEAIDVIKRFITDGHIYQINLSQLFTFPWLLPPESLYQKIRVSNSAPFCAFFKKNDWSILSTSPERFLHRDGSRISTEPIKGTRPRGRNQIEDEENLKKLLASEKERAEHIMIVDLLRNDLGRVCEFGSVYVEEKFYVEKYKSVHQLISRVVGTLPSEATIGSILEETYPGGSITGCPKKRAMELIAAFERHRRSVYTGSLGRISVNLQNFDLSILIRTVIIQQGVGALSLGGGIVFDSKKKDEFSETIDKGLAITSVLNNCLSELIKLEN